MNICALRIDRGSMAVVIVYYEFYESLYFSLSDDICVLSIDEDL